MAEAPKDVLGFLEQLRKERRELELVITSIEKRLGIGPEADRADEQRDAQPKNHHARMPEEIPVGFFHNLSQAAAAEKLLRIRPNTPLTTPTILEAFRKAGLDVNPKNATTILYTTLTRSPKFERVAGKAWGLAEWYPERKRARDDRHDGGDES
jgi:hypothetical protein